MKTKDIVLIGMFAAVLAAISQIALPMPSGVPISIQVFGVALVGSVLGWKRGCMASVIYILLGAVGLPVFANFKGGMGVIMGYGGGYIAAWPIMALLCGISSTNHKKSADRLLRAFLAVLGVLIVELAGGYRWAMLAGDRTFLSIMAYSMVAFIPKDIILTIVGVFLGERVKMYMNRAGYLE